MTAFNCAVQADFSFISPLLGWAFECPSPVRAGEDQEGGVSASGPRIPLPFDAFERSHVVKVVHDLPPPHLAWLKLTYTRFSDFESEQLMIMHCWQLWLSEQPAMRDKTVQECKQLMFLASQEARMLANKRKRSRSPADLQRMLGVKESNWRQHWKSRWETMLMTFLFLDADALQSLYEQLPVDFRAARYGV